MEKKKVFFIIVSIICLIIFCFITSDNDTNVNNDANIVTSSVEESSTLIQYYKDNEMVNEFINIFNNIYPDNKITSDMLSVYNHHGSDHKEQVQFYLDGLQITLTGSTLASSTKVSVYIDNTKNYNSDETLRNLTKKFIKVYNNSIPDSQIEGYLNNQGSSSDINTYDNIEYWTNKKLNSNIIEYIKITGNL